MFLRQQPENGGHPDRFANEYEALCLCLHPADFHSPAPQRGQVNVVNVWGVTNRFPEGIPGSVYGGVYETIMDAIDDYYAEKFAVKKSEILRSPLQFEKKGYM